ncbi:hypothetical protein AAA799P11_00071 [Marine Group I thaumarchaeote SCGC AAA799-P11]|uniref:Uncharacterized protein n=1 Tax=Marine Group I thaumarchaeote SCGC AAA799-P11 TaxID=1502295 RepID=A0A087S3M0_9ARCH|nr:hypothetical protein AAA799P11_00071 [Marine Group I thaumarchaeote SCGC AAA799-P11]
MHKLSFVKTMEQFDLMISVMDDANKKNNFMFRELCVEVFRKSYSKLKSKNDLNVTANFLVGELFSAINNNKTRNKVTRAKSLRKLNAKKKVLTYSDLNKVCQFIKTSEFSLVVKLLKIQHNYGLNEAISAISD